MAQQLIEEKKQDTVYRLQPTDIVLISNLKSKQNYNGLLAKVVKYIPSKQRYAVSTYSTQNTHHIILVKSVNLKIIYSAKYSVNNKFCFNYTNPNCRTSIHGKEMAALENIRACVQCRSVYYCSKTCIEMHRNCLAYKEFAQKEYKHIAEMDNLFQFDNVVTYSDENDALNSNEYFLYKMNLKGKGIWKRFGKIENAEGISFGELQNAFSIEHYSMIKTKQLILPSFDEKQILKSDKVIKNWGEYYKMKNISLKSPIAHWMSWVLTIYHTLTKYIGIKPNFDSVKDIVIHLVGVEVELDLLPYFRELLCLLPGYNFFFYLFGDSKEISDKKDEIIFRIGQKKEFIKINVCKCNYKRQNIQQYIKAKQHQLPRVVIGLNSGLSAGDKNGALAYDWFGAIDYILNNKLQAVFTEYVCNTIKCAEITLLPFPSRFSVKYVVNPFRSPIINFLAGVRFSRADNGFICGFNI